MSDNYWQQKIEAGSLKDKIAGGIYGLLIADAVGVPYEFQHSSVIPEIYELSYKPPAGFNRSWSSVELGTWSDDGATALCVMASMIEKDGFDAHDLAAKLVAWKNDKYMAVDGRVFDVGRTTEEALDRVARGISPLESGATEYDSKGNGSLMRVLPLALFHNGSDAELVNDAMTSSAITHATTICKVSCAIYCLWARKILQGESNPWFAATLAMEKILPPESMEAMVFQGVISPRSYEEVKSASGYVLDSLNIARRIIPNAKSYEETVISAIKFGMDTDTNACIAGGLAGVKFGYNSIPKHLIDGLRGKELFNEILDKAISNIQVSKSR